MVKLTQFLILFLLNLIAIGQSPLSQAVKKVIPSVFLIKTFDSQHKELAIGTGFFVDSLGTGITNYHVLEGASAATITLQEGSEFPIEYINGQDEQRDLIRFRVKSSSSAKGLDYLKLSNKKPQLGEDVFTIGNPEGLSFSVSDGIVSSVREDEIGTVIQTTAPISPGSSGSPLLNLKGEVIGVISFYYDDGQNLNFAMSSKHITQLENSIPNYTFPISKKSKFNVNVDENYFKRHAWSSTHSFVKQNEKSHFTTSRLLPNTAITELSYTSDLLDMPVNLTYNFEGGQLSLIQYGSMFSNYESGHERHLGSLNESLLYFLVTYSELNAQLGNPCGCVSYSQNEWDYEFAPHIPTKDSCLAIEDFTPSKIRTTAKESFERGKLICKKNGKEYDPSWDSYIYRVSWETETSIYSMGILIDHPDSFSISNPSYKIDYNPNNNSMWFLNISPKTEANCK